MSYIVVKKEDGGIIIITPNPKKYGEGMRPLEKCKGLKIYIDQGLDWFVSDQVVDKSDLESRKQLYCEGDEIKKDLKWEKRLMPDQIIKKRLIKKLNERIDVIIESETSNPMEAIKCHRECEKLKLVDAGNQNKNIFWAQKAIEGLDERVSIGEGDKPVIRKKLQELISKK